MATLFELAARLQMANAAETLLMLVVKATLILVIARLLLAAMPRAAAATKHVVATAALIAVGLMPVLTVVVPAWDIVVARVEARGEAGREPTPILSPSDVPEGAAETLQTEEPARRGVRPLTAAFSIARATGVVPDEPLTAMERAMNIVRSTWKGMIVIAVGLVALLLLAQMVLGMLGVWFVSRKAEELTQDSALKELDAVRDQLALGLEVRLLRSSRISVPVIWGVTRPVLLLPTDVVTWPAERLRVVLLHELAHLKRFDGISLLLTRIAVSLFWFHPVAWSLERAGRSECERACDDLVLAGGTKPSEYADHLLAIARSMPTFDPFRSVTLAMSRKSQLEGRLLSILQPHVARRVFTGRRVAIACALAIAVMIPFSALRLTAGRPDEKEVAERKATERKSNAVVEVKPELEAIQDYFLTKLGKYDKRVDKFARQPRTGKEWYERAYDYYHNERLEEAAAAFHRAYEEGYRRNTSLYNEACSYALLGDADRAIPTLQAAIDAGWDDVEHIGEDSDFDPIRSDPRFAKVVSASEREIVTRRVDQTVERYNDLRSGRVPKDEDEDADHGDDESIGEAVAEAVREAVRDKMGQREDSEWASVGVDLLRLRKLDESIDAFQRSIAANERVDTSMYNIACAYSLKGDVRSGMEWLEKSIDHGFSNGDKFENDPDIALLRKQPGFAALQRKAEDLELRGCCNHADDWLKTFIKDDWTEVVEHHRRMVDRHPTVGRAWFNLGFVSIKSEDYPTAVQSFRKSIELGYRPGTSSYNVACAYALQGDSNAAFDWLDRARRAGFDVGNHMVHDDDLDSLHDDSRWEALAAELDVERHSWIAPKKRHK